MTDTTLDMFKLVIPDVVPARRGHGHHRPHGSWNMTNCSAATSQTVQGRDSMARILCYSYFPDMCKMKVCHKWRRTYNSCHRIWKYTTGVPEFARHWNLLGLATPWNPCWRLRLINALDTSLKKSMIESLFPAVSGTTGVWRSVRQHPVACGGDEGALGNCSGCFIATNICTNMYRAALRGRLLLQVSWTRVPSRQS